MSQPETKTVLGRVFTWNSFMRVWSCRTERGYLELKDIVEAWTSRLTLGENRLVYIAIGHGNTESDAILALQGTLRKMSELEVVDG